MSFNVEQPEESGSASMDDAIESLIDLDSEEEQPGPDDEDVSEEEVESDDDQEEQSPEDDDSDDQEAEEEGSEDEEQPEEDEDTEEESSSDELDLSHDAVYVIDGEEVTGAQLKSERMAHADYTRGKQELAKQVKDNQHQFMEQNENLAAAIQLAVNRKQNEFNHLYSSTNWNELQVSDPAKYQETIQQVQQLKSEIEKDTQEFDVFVNSLKQQHEQFLQNEAEETIKALSDGAIDGWSNELYSSIREYAVSLGYEGDKFNQITDLPTIQMLHKAMKYDELQEKPVKTKKRSKPVKSSTTKKTAAGANKVAVKRKEAAKRKFSKTRSDEDAVALILE